MSDKLEHKKKPLVKAVPKSALTLRYEAIKERVWARAAKVRTAFFADTWQAGLMWFGAAVVLIGMLLWFFFLSGYGNPAEPIYEGF